MKFAKLHISQNYIWLSICAGFLGVFLMGMPKYFDDWWFMGDFRPWFEAQGLVSPQNGGDIVENGFPWAPFLDTVGWHFYYDNTRLSNVFAIPMLLLPKWVASLPAWICWIVVMAISLKLSRVDWRRSRLIPWAVAMWLVCMPWYDNMACVMYEYNYIVPSALAVLLLLWVLRGNVDGWSLLWLFLYSAFTSAWHEMFTAQLIVLFVVLLLIPGATVRRAVSVALAGSLVAMVWLILCPDFFNRASLDLWGGLTDAKRCLKILVLHHSIILVFLLWSFIRILRRGVGNFLDDRFLVAAAVIGVCSCFVAISVSEFVRAGWFGDILAVPGILRLADTSTLSIPTNIIRILRVCGYCLMAGSFYVAAISDIYVLKYAGQYRKAAEQLGAGEGDSIFVDVEPIESMPLVTHRYISNSYLWDFVGFMKLYYRRLNSKSMLKLVPDELEDFDFSRSAKIPGNSGAKIVKGHIVVAYEDGAPESAGFYDMQFGPFYKQEVPFEFIPFTNRADGHRYAFLIMTDRQVFRRLFGVASMDKASLAPKYIIYN